MELYNEEKRCELHDCLLKIGAYEMIFEKQKNLIYALKKMNHGMAKELQRRIDNDDKLLKELEEYDKLSDDYHKQFTN